MCIPAVLRRLATRSRYALRDMALLRLRQFESGETPVVRLKDSRASWLFLCVYVQLSGRFRDHRLGVGCGDKPRATSGTYS